MHRHTRCFSWLVLHGFTTYLLMTLAFVVFGVLSLDLVKYVAANANFLFENGLLAIMEGGLQQFVELWVEVLLAIAAYLIFKLCEHAIIERVAHGNPSHGVTVPQLSSMPGIGGTSSSMRGES